jgi:hypothetical protein
LTLNLRCEPAALGLEAGQDGGLGVEVLRQNGDGPVEVTVEELPEGVEAKPVTIATGQNAGRIELKAADEAHAGAKEIRVRARLGKVADEQRVKLTVRATPALRLDPVTALVLKPGGNGVVKVRVQRRHCKGPLQLAAADLPEGVTAEAGRVAADATDGELRLSATAGARLGTGKARLTATAGDVRAEAPFDITVQIDVAAEARAVDAVQRLGGRVETEGPDPGGGAVVKVDLARTKVTETELRKALQDLPRLQELSLLKCGWINDAALAHLLGRNQLRVLDLSHTGVTSAGLTVLKGLPQLRTLRLHGCKGIGDAALDHLKGLAHLQELSLIETAVTGTGLEALKDLPELRKLNLQSCAEIDDDALPRLKTLGKLTDLDLSGTRVTAAGLAALRDLDGLLKLRLSYTKVAGAGLAALQGLPRLQELEMQGCQGINNEALAHVKDLQQLQKLDLSKTRVTGAGLEALRGLSRLQKLDLQNCDGVDNAGLEHLKALKELQELNLKDTAVTDDGVRDLQAARPKLSVTH